MSSIDMPPAVILCGGLGTRLRSIVSDRPKVLVEVSGKPFIEHIFDILLEQGVTEAVLASGHQHQILLEQYPDRYKGLSIIHSIEEQQLGTGGALALAATHIKSDYFIVMNGDSFCNVDLRALFYQTQNKNMVGAVAVVQSINTGASGIVILNDQGIVTEFREKDPDYNGTCFINGGIYCLKRSLFNSISIAPCSIEYDLFPLWINTLHLGGILGFETAEDLLLDIGTPDGLIRTKRYFDSLRIC